MNEMPNIILVVLDTVRASNVSGYGYKRNTTPFLEEFGDQSINYTHAYSPAPWTTPSHASIFTGTYPITHQTNRQREVLTPDLPTLAELLQDSGYDTIGFSNNAHISPRFNFDRGFDQFIFNTESYNEPLESAVPISELRNQVNGSSFIDTYFNAIKYVRGENKSFLKTAVNWIYRKSVEKDLMSANDRGARSTNEFVENYLKNNYDSPFFMYLNYMEAHAPYQAPDEYQYRYVKDPITTGWENSQADYFHNKMDNQKKRITDLYNQYDGCIQYLDTKIEELMNIFSNYSIFDDSLIIITSDHGEAFGEHDVYEHKVGIYDETVHIPMWLNPPQECIETIETPVSNLWIFPTILQLADINFPKGTIQANLFDPANDPIVIEGEGFPYDSSSQVLMKFSQPHRSYIDNSENYKLIYYPATSETELYKIEQESEDISTNNEDRCKKYLSKLETYINENRKARSDAEESFEIDEKTKEHLRKLGYQ